MNKLLVVAEWSCTFCLLMSVGMVAVRSTDDATYFAVDGRDDEGHCHPRGAGAMIRPDTDLTLACLLLSGATVTTRDDREIALLKAAGGFQCAVADERDVKALVEVLNG